MRFDEPRSLVRDRSHGLVAFGKPCRRLPAQRRKVQQFDAHMVPELVVLATQLESLCSEQLLHRHSRTPIANLLVVVGVVDRLPEIGCRTWRAYEQARELDRRRDHARNRGVVAIDERTRRVSLGVFCSSPRVCLEALHPVHPPCRYRERAWPPRTCRSTCP